MRTFLKVFAWLCKIAAIVFWLGAACAITSLDISSLRMPSHWRESDDWGTPEYHHRIYLEIVILTMLAVFALLPNRWLVFRPWIFAISLLVALSPIFELMTSVTEWSDLIWVVLVVVMISPLPLCIILSFWWHRKGEKVGYV